MIRGFHQGPRPFGRSSRGRTYASSQPGSERSEERLDRGGVHICFAMQSRGRRKKGGGGRCGRRARRSRSSVRPMPIEIADGAPVSGKWGNTAMAAVPRAPRLENGNGGGSAGRATAALIFIVMARTRLTGAMPSLWSCSHSFTESTAHDAAEGPSARCRADPPGLASDPRFPALLHQRLGSGRHGSQLVGVDATATKAGPSDASPRWGIRRNDRRPVALVIEAEWRKRAEGVVPAQPRARPEGQRPMLDDARNRSR
jgi:hypothetical protein